MPVVSHTLTQPAGEPIANAVVYVRLLATATAPNESEGFVASNQTGILSERKILTDSTGKWTITLTANALITPANTTYQVIQPGANGSKVVETFIVPNGAGPFWLGDILAAAPVGLPGYALDTHAALTTGVHGVGTSTVESVAGSQAKVDTHNAAASPHAGIFALRSTLPFNVKNPPAGFTAAVGDGVADDTAALQAAIDACIATGALTTTRQALRPIYLPPGSYKVSAPLNIRSVQGFWLYGSGKNLVRFKGTGTIDSVLNIDGCADGLFENFSINGVDTHMIDKCISLQWSGSGVIGRSTTGNMFRNIKINEATYRSAYAIGTASANRQVDGTILIGCMATGAYVRGSGNTTQFQYGFECGSGTHGNVLGTQLYGCESTMNRRGMGALATSLVVIGGQPASNEIDFYKVGASTPFTVQGIRTEGSYRLFEDATPTSAASMVSLKDIVYKGQNIHADGYWIYYSAVGTLRLDNVKCEVPAVTASIFAQAPANNPQRIIATGLQQPTPLATGFFLPGAGARVTVVGYVQTDSGNLVVTNTMYALLSSAGVQVIIDDGGVKLKEGTNAKMGVATLVSGSATVANTSVTANSRIVLTGQDNNVTGALRVSARTAGTSFTVTSSAGTDSGVVAYQIFEPT